MNGIERFFTYHELMARYSVSRRTLTRWACQFQFRLFSPTHNTVRIPLHDLQRFEAAFIKTYGTTPGASSAPKPRKKRSLR